MFAIYGISGPIFQGTLEKMNQIPPVLRRGPVTPVRRIGDQIETSTFTEELANITAPTGTAEKAVEAYQEMLPQNLERGPLFLANQIMQPQVISVNAADDVARAWQVLVQHQIHQAPVLDAGLHLVGIVSERNLLTTLNVDGGQVRDVLARSVSDVMTTPVVAATPITDIRRIALVMLDRDVDGVPIVNDTGTLLGFISRSDILRAVVTDPPLSIWR
ncbi:HPP family protein [Propionivibrio sp.]|uniref:CBS domain-containing protein n=1 Tax=Propionivibrio sp. TaxID=2212460 RepID=UPI003BF37538